MASRAHEEMTFWCRSPLHARFASAKRSVVAAVVFGAFFWFQSTMEELELSVVLGLAALAVFALATFWPTRVVLGEDAMRVVRYGVGRTVRYAEIASVSSLQRLGGTSEHSSLWEVATGVRVTLEGGGHIDLGTGAEQSEVDSSDGGLWTGRVGRFGVFDRAAWRLSKEIDARLRAWREREVRERPSAQTPLVRSLMRGGRSVVEWRRALEEAAPVANETYRSGEGGTVEALWRVVEDEEAPNEARAGAAVALRRRLDVDGRARMRVVLDGDVSPKVRVALEASLEEEESDEAVRRALEGASATR